MRSNAICPNGEINFPAEVQGRVHLENCFETHICAHRAGAPIRTRKSLSQPGSRQTPTPRGRGGGRLTVKNKRGQPRMIEPKWLRNTTGSDTI